MSALPQGWEMKTLGELGDYWNGRGFKTNEWSDSGRPIIRIQNLTGSGSTFNCFEGEVDERHIARPGDLLVSWAATLGVYEWKGPEGVVNQHIFKVDSFINKRFHRYLLDHALDDLKAKTHGSGMVHITRRRFDETPVMVPQSPTEQQRIVEVIEEQFSRLDAGVESLQRAKRNLARLRDSILRSAVQGRLVGQVPAERGVSEAIRSIMLRGDRPRPDPSTLRALPEGWAWLWLPELGELGRGKSKHRPRNDPRLYGGPYPFVQTGDVRNSGGRITSHSQTYSEEGLAQSRLWPTETVCITIAANIADSALLTYPACFPDSVVGLIANPEVALPEFIEMFIRTARSRLDAFAPATAQKNINLRILSNVAIPVPPIEEQARIVDEVSRYQSIIDMVESQIETGSLRSATLRGAILHDAFAGHLVSARRTA